MNKEEFNIEIKKCHSGSQAHDVCLKYIESLEKENRYLNSRIEALCNPPRRGTYE